MTPSAFFLRSGSSRFWPISLALIACLLFVYLSFRSASLYPVVYDEFVYSRFSRLAPLGESIVPNYLYLALMSLSSQCGDGFLQCARLVNSLLFVGALPFIYLITRNVASRPLSLWVTLLAVLGPVNSYTAYFMPEAIYFAGFWLLMWCMLRLDSQAPTGHWLIAGLVYGLLALIKPHALLITPALALYGVYLACRSSEVRFGAVLAKLAVLLASAAAVKFLGGYVLAGSAGLTLFGSLYGGITETGVSGADTYFDVLFASLRNLSGHLMVLALLYGLPFVVIVTYGLHALMRSNSAHSAASRLYVLALLLLPNLVYATALFTALAVTTGPDESLYRLHMRYYNFALPIAYIAVAAFFSQITVVANNRLRSTLLVAFFGAFALTALYTVVQPFTASFVDNPDFMGTLPHSHIGTFRALGALSFVALLLWLLSPLKACRYYLLVFAPLFVGIASWNVSVEQRNRLVPDTYDRAMMLTKSYLSGTDLSEVLFVVPHLGAFYRSAVHLNHADLRVEVRSTEGEFDVASVVSPPPWILIIGLARKPENFDNVVSGEGFTLVRTAAP